MLRKHRLRTQSELGCWYRGADVPMSVIRRFARQVAERFHPEKIILFGSYAYGRPHADSDVDFLVVMPARNQLDQAFKLHVALLPPFPLDLLVRTPQNLKWRLAEGDSFLREIVTKGKVLYEQTKKSNLTFASETVSLTDKKSDTSWKQGPCYRF
jgi:predicted nucleotidyltransferase